MIEAAGLDELEEGKPLVRKVGGRDVVLVRWRGEVYALRDVCPHQSASFLFGTVHDLVTGDAALGELAVDRSDPVIKCPWHAWQFRLRTGECLVDPALRTRTYAVTVRDGTVLLDMGGRGVD
jgi:nitrite reductase/ring-hydroxylating ferredoxin subunit